MIGQFLHHSAWTWAFLRDAPFRPREDTITESILVDIARDRARHSIVAKSSQSEEAAMGHDWAWAIHTPVGWLHLLVQAKETSLKSPATYPELHKPKAVAQAAALIAAAGRLQALPVYAFYNGSAEPFGRDGNHVAFGGCRHPRLTREIASYGPPWTTGKSAMGVTFAHASDVLRLVRSKSADRSHATTINGVAMPWECLFCPSWKETDKDPWTPQISSAAIGLRAVAELEGTRSFGPERDAFPWLNGSPPAWAEVALEQSFNRDFERLLVEDWSSLELPPNVRYGLITQLSDEEWRPERFP